MINFEDKQYPETHLHIQEENFLAVKGKQLNFTNTASNGRGRDRSYSCQMRLNREQVKELIFILNHWVKTYYETPDKYEEGGSGA